MICVVRVRVTLARGALVRVLRLVEHRCAHVVDVRVDTCTDDGSALVELTVEGKVPPDSLAQQVKKLYDVREVEIVSRRLSRERRCVP